ncbi:CPBP family intramembrane glutamic endopeptidase, BDIM_20840 family [Amphiplicatus metriothermophilus]|uniref:CAAX prenyl protease 2/Lysostaphin resistance protein A-like domain-containing protein n=1 Tax=Amphiplicatus metriothermophilus TaxID=1519374 RepID=A0A239PJY5_9PROT|nr:CPBP family intramembrane glutamic endopeptidase [Amphiplicatus metriothermophilus]MBB5517806.1 hypothetical protein [Amphiplicatus metriothermophilus]SNT67860.1 hypothetical protein SAMN06297382_0353 [Amphiplicatus metriothermophilus]
MTPMQNELMTVGLHVGVVAALGFAGAAVFRGSFRPAWFAGALALYIVYDALLTRGFWTLPDMFPGSEWNWTGKLLSFAGMAVAAVLLGRRKVGATLRQAPGSRAAWVVFVVLAAALFALAWRTGDGRPDDLETIAFQWTMPGLDEELFFRGALLVALNEAFAACARIFGAPIGYGGLLTAVLFGLVHALDYGAAGVGFDAMTFAATGGPSLILLWMREKTGSLLLPVLAHNVSNGAFTLF